jgi:hypothetical protein
MLKKLFLWLVLVMVLAIALPIFAQDNDTIPPALTKFLSESFIAAVMAIIGIVKLVRNMLGGVKGWIAVAVTAVISLVVGFVQYGSSGLLFGLLAGVLAFLVAAGVFKGTKLIGTAVTNAQPK